MEPDFTPKGTNNALSPFLWGGSYRDGETGHYWMRNRYYHVGMKRFINSDPIGFWGDANNLGNGFSYVAGMVVEHSDPTGLDMQRNFGTTSMGIKFVVDRGATAVDTAISVASVATSVANKALISGTKAALRQTALEGIKSLASAAITSAINTLAGPGVHMVSFFGEEGAKIVNEIGTDLAKEYEADFFVYKKTKEGAEITVEGKKGKKTIIINLEEEKKKREKSPEQEIQQPEQKPEQEKEIEEESPQDNIPDAFSADPDTNFDRIQQYLALNTIKKILGPRGKERKEKGEEEDREEWEKNPIVPYRSEDGLRQFIHNPFYREPDMLFQVFIDYEDVEGRREKILNPFRVREKEKAGTSADKATFFL